MRVMFNTNVMCRPYDDLRQARIRIEATAALTLLKMVRETKFDLLYSETLDAELCGIANDQKKDTVLNSIEPYVKAFIPFNQTVEQLGLYISQKCSIPDLFDCYHIASAVLLHADYFITCDDELTRKVDSLERVLKKKEYTIYIRNPVDFLQEVNLNDIE